MSRKSHGSAAVRARCARMPESAEVRARVQRCAAYLKRVASRADMLAEGPEPENGAALLADIASDLESDLVFFRKVARSLHR